MVGEIWEYSDLILSTSTYGRCIQLETIVGYMWIL